MKNFFWPLPFIFFLTGYFLLSHFYTIQTIAVPSLVGKSLSEAITILSDSNLNTRILKKQEDPDLPPGTIISQTPHPTHIVKPQQSVFLIITTQPENVLAPQLLGKKMALIEKELQDKTLRRKVYLLPSYYPSNTCIGQTPCAGKPLTDKKMIMYCASNTRKPTLLPNFKNKSIIDVTQSLKNQGVAYTILDYQEKQHNHKCTEQCTVIDQRPLAYSIITEETYPKLQVQLQVKHT